MSERDTSQLGKVVRWISRAIGAALVLWALADDPLIGGGPGFGFTQGFVALVGLGLIGSSFAPLAWNGRALALVLSAGFMFLVGEVGARVLFSARYERPFVLDEKTLYRLSPDTLREFIRQPVNGGDRILYRVNAAGYRGEELASDPRLRVVVYGDSFIQGEFSSLENTFTERLEHHLSRRLGIELEVVNAGIAGYGPDQALLKMEGEIEALAPDLVVMAVFAGNDFGDMVRNKLFRVRASGGLTENSFTIDPSVRREMNARRRELLLKRVVRDSVHALAIALGLREAKTSDMERLSPKERLEAFRRQHVEEYEEYVVRGDNTVHEIAWDTYDADVSLTPNSDSARYKARLMEAVLHRMQALASRQSIPLVLLPIPHPLDLGGHDTGEVDSQQFPDYAPRNLVGILESIARRRGMPVVDLFSRFTEIGPGETYFQGFDDHWNDHGQDLAGDWVAEFLVREGLLGPSPRVAATSERGD